MGAVVREGISGSRGGMDGVYWRHGREDTGSRERTD